MKIFTLFQLNPSFPNKFWEQAYNPVRKNSIENILNCLKLQQNCSEKKFFENLANFEMINWIHNLRISLKEDKVYRTFLQLTAKYLNWTLILFFEWLLLEKS